MSRHRSRPAPRVRNAAVMLVFAAFGLAGCSRGYTEVSVVHASRPRPVVYEPRVVVIEKGHRHSHRCGHYCHKGTWYYAKDHVHRKGCGHRKAHGRWVLVEK